jgi:uncharacterized protein YecT (DUF1311 family)
MKIAILLLSVLFSLQISAKEIDICLKKAMTQYDMNNCEKINLTHINNELNRVLNKIKKIYHKDKYFLNSLKKSQLLWDESKKANMQMRFPLENKALQYGSVYPMCHNSIESKLTIERILFLKQWLIGVKEGDVCSGSIKQPYEIRQYNKSVK